MKTFVRENFSEPLSKSTKKLTKTGNSDQGVHRLPSLSYFQGECTGLGQGQGVGGASREMGKIYLVQRLRHPPFFVQHLILGPHYLMTATLFVQHLILGPDHLTIETLTLEVETCNFKCKA